MPQSQSQSRSQPQNQNPFLLAADASPALLPLLHSQPSLATSQDAHGYSLLHALTSYNHFSLLRSLTSEFTIPPNLTDEDGETALFVAESVEAAQMLVEEVGVDPGVRNAEGLTAEEKIRLEGEFGGVADYLGVVRGRGDGFGGERQGEGGDGQQAQQAQQAPVLPNGVRVEVGSMHEEDVPAEPDPDLRRRIEELASRDDFAGVEGQRELRELVQDAVRDVGSEERDVRRRVQ